MARSDSPDASGEGGHPYDRRYFESYHTEQGPVPYDRAHGQWIEFFASVADRIVTEIMPARVLDVGCAKGFLVEALRDRGVEAFGIDISEYAIGEVRADIRSYCRVASAVEPLGDTYDLIVCIEVVEHLSDEEGRRAIANICRSAADVLFSSTPDDFTEPTHVNVRPGSWWIERFADHAFQLDVRFDAGFVAPHAMRFRRGPAASLVDSLLVQRGRLLQETAALRADGAAKEAALRDRQAEVEALRGEGRAADELIAGLSALRDGLHADVARLRQEALLRDAVVAGLRRGAEEQEEIIAGLRRGAEEQEEIIAGLRRGAEEQDKVIAGLREGAEEQSKLIAGLNYHLLAVQRTIGWKVLTHLRRVRDRMLPTDSRRRNLYSRVRRPVEVLLDEGPQSFVRKTHFKVQLMWRGQGVLVKRTQPEATPNTELQYQVWMERHRLRPDGVATMKATARRFAYTPVISIVTPVYNTDEVWLRKAIESARAQIYPRWELCLVNDESTRPHVKGVLDEYAALEPRVRVKHLSRNHGIAGASNHGLGMATGEFVALLDHDDEIPPETLFEVVKLLNEDPALDLIYTDEDKLDIDGSRVEPFFKPDWSPDLLLSMNYITHLSVFRRSLLVEIGGFRLGLDGSQDYDLLLRFAERARRIAHIPKILYHWRKIPGSAAASAAAKPFAYEAGRQAIEHAVQRRGHQAAVGSGPPGQYLVRYRVTGSPLVSIIIPTRDRWSLLQQCLRSIEERTRYARYEIIVLDNNSTEPETLNGLDAVAAKWRVFSRPGSFNFSALNNFGAAQAGGEYFVFLNNDTQVVEPDWLGAMLEHAQRPQVGAVGARLHYPDGRIQHAGLLLGVGGVADHAFRGLPGTAASYFAFADVVRNVSAVTAACMMVPRRVFEDVRGFDERFRVSLNDVDLCLRLRRHGYLVVYTPYALLYHHESGTRGRLHPPEDEALVWTLWGDVIRKGDPYYNPNLTLSRTDWTLGG